MTIFLLRYSNCLHPIEIALNLFGYVKCLQTHKIKCKSYYQNLDQEHEKMLRNYLVIIANIYSWNGNFCEMFIHDNKLTHKTNLVLFLKYLKYDLLIWILKNNNNNNNFKDVQFNLSVKIHSSPIMERFNCLAERRSQKKCIWLYF